MNTTDRAWGLLRDEGWQYPRYYSYYDYKFRRYKRGILGRYDTFTLRVFLYTTQKVRLAWKDKKSQSENVQDNLNEFLNFIHKRKGFDIIECLYAFDVHFKIFKIFLSFYILFVAYDNSVLEDIFILLRPHLLDFVFSSSIFTVSRNILRGAVYVHWSQCFFVLPYSYVVIYVVLWWSQG